MAPGNRFSSSSRSGLDQNSGLAGALATAGGFTGVAPAGFGAVGTPALPDGGLPSDDRADLGAGASPRVEGDTPLVSGVGFCATSPLAALGGAFGSSAISVDACGKAPFYGQQNHAFLHIADKHVNRENAGLRSQDSGFRRELASFHVSFPHPGAELFGDSTLGPCRIPAARAACSSVNDSST